MKKSIAIIGVLAAILAVGALLWPTLRGAWPAFGPTSGDIARDLATTTSTGPLSLPAGFSISTLASVPGARVIRPDFFGNLWVSQTPRGTISLVDIKSSTTPQVYPILRDLRNPHGLAFDSFALYFAEEDKISRVTVYSDDSVHKIIDLPPGGRHTTRTLGIGSDKRLYVSIGSSCDVCYEADPRRAAIYSMRLDGSDFKEYAKGLRNAVFFTWDSEGSMWATEMGRDNLGDNIPPDEINRVSLGEDFGWPICYGDGIHDSVFDKRQYFRDPCDEKVAAEVMLPAHSAPLGIAFIPNGSNSKWPKEIQGDMLVAYHGSWNRTVPTGYKIVRVHIKSDGHSEISDFITGWLTKDGNVLGRPVDIIADDTGAYITDDKAGLVYRLSVAR